MVAYASDLAEVSFGAPSIRSARVPCARSKNEKNCEASGQFGHLLDMSELRHFVYRPGEALRRYVREVLFLDSEPQRIQVLLPETTPTLMLQQSGCSALGGRKLPSAAISGLQSAARTVEVSSSSAIAIVRFTETGAAGVIRDSLHSLYDSSIAIDDVLVTPMLTAC
jgi:hypothetical protein